MMGIRVTGDLRGLQDSEDCRASKVSDEAVIGCFTHRASEHLLILFFLVCR